MEGGNNCSPCRPDGTDVPLPAIYIGILGTRTPRQGYRFLPDGTGLMYTPAQTTDLEFWVLNLATKMTRRVAKLTLPDEIRTFDLAPDGKQIIFDRLRDNADIVLDCSRQRSSAARALN